MIAANDLNTWLECFGNAFDIDLKLFVLYHAGAATYTMVTIVSITTARWGIPPVPLHHSNILLWKGCYTGRDLNPHLLIAGQTRYHYATVPRWQRRMNEMCLACSLSILIVHQLHMPPRKLEGNQHHPDCSTAAQMGRGWDMVASQLFMQVVLYHAGAATFTMVTIVSITTARWGVPPVPLHHSNILLWKGCYTGRDLNLHLLIAGQTRYHYATVPRWQRRMNEMCLACSLSILIVHQLHMPPRKLEGNQHHPDCSTAAQMGRGWDLVASQSFMPVVLYHAGAATYTMVTIVSITTARWGVPPVPLHHSNILLWKGCYTGRDLNLHLLIAGQTRYHYATVPRWQRRMNKMCLACSLSILIVHQLHMPPRKLEGNQDHPDCSTAAQQCNLTLIDNFHMQIPIFKGPQFFCWIFQSPNLKILNGLPQKWVFLFQKHIQHLETSKRHPKFPKIIKF